MRWSEHGEDLYRESEMLAAVQSARIRWFVAGIVVGAFIMTVGVVVRVVIGS